VDFNGAGRKRPSLLSGGSSPGWGSGPASSTNGSNATDGLTSTTIPRDFWLEPLEKEAIIGFRGEHPLEGYRRLAFMMLDANVVAVSHASVWRVLRNAGLLSRWKGKPSLKGTSFK